ncbi:UNVERIFIED_CONTAM: hypothetical protein GTU68_022666 [Idotea baltica]|nr:hypothetical protein [Idotea baltica]
MAEKLAYQSSLGDPLFKNYYLPWKGFVWWNQSPNISAIFYKQFALIASAASLIYGLCVFFLVTYNPATKGNETLHGTSKWADWNDVKKSGLLKPASDGEGVVIGGYEHKGKLNYLYHKGSEHVAVVAPTGSGKGVSLLLPTLFSWTSSVFVLDLKAEAWSLTSGWRKKWANNVVLKFEPADSTSTGARFNPLAEIRIHTDFEVGDTQVISDIIVKPDGQTGNSSGSSKFFEDTSMAFVTGLMLHLLYKHEAKGWPKANLPDVANALSDPQLTFDLLLIEMIGNNYYNGASHPLVESSAQDVLEMDERLQSNVKASVRQYFTLYRDPIISKNIAQSDFKIDDLQNHEKPVSLYLVIPPREKARLMPIVRIMMTLVQTNLMKEMEYKEGRSVRSYKHKLLTLYDEFTSLGKMPIIEEQLAYIRSYGLMSYIIIQDIHQLYKHYTVNETFLSGAHVKCFFAPNEIKTAEYISKILGKTTVTKKDASMTGKRFSVLLGRVTTHEREHARELLKPEEILKLKSPEKDDRDNITKAGEMLVHRVGDNPIRGTQPLYFLDETFLARSKVPPPERSDSIILAHHNNKFVSDENDS